MKEVTIADYRRILKDDITPGELIQKRLDYLAAFCRNVARMEIEKAINENKAKKHIQAKTD